AEALVSLIHEKRSAIIAKWYDSSVCAYAPETTAFLKSQKDQFANPVGSSTRKGIEALLDQLLGDMHGETIAVSLDPIMRIRAVQSLSPAQATAFIFALKQILRDMFDRELQDAGMARQFFEFEERIDRVCLAAFEIYLGCREQVFELKANEMRNRTFRAFKRAGLVAEPAEEEPPA
ncbi:MAG: RsbRD N-terminal domain-containing protein, partial [Desulfobacterales bacterium]|nr:RsbRD N-terminal domain-containing protein [Desulfobacterales bacterium]